MSVSLVASITQQQVTLENRGVVNMVTTHDIDLYSEANYDAGIYQKLYDVNPNLGGGLSQSFTVPSDYDYRLNTAKFYLNRNGACTGGEICAKVYEHSGTYGTSSIPTGAALATSDVIDATTIGGDAALVTFTFSGAEKIILTKDTYYVVTIEGVTQGTMNSSDAFIRCFADWDAPTHDGNYAGVNTTWTPQAGTDLIFYVIGNYHYDSITPSACTMDTTGKTPYREGLVNAGSAAATFSTLTTNQKVVNQIIISQDTVEIEKLSFYGSCPDGDGRVRLKGVIYADNDGEPAALLGTTQELGINLSSSNGPHDLPFLTPLLLNSGTYWIGFIEVWDENTTVFHVYYTATTDALKFNNDTYSDGPADPFGATSTSSVEMSLWATYWVEEDYPRAVTGHVVVTGELGGKDNRGTIAKETIRWQEKAFYAAGRIWLFYADSVQLGTGRYSSWFSSSVDNGVTWETPTLYSDECLENVGEGIQAILDDNGYVHMVTRELFDGDIQLAYRRGLPNSDGTITWTAAKAKAWTDTFAASVDFYACLDSYGYMWISWGLTTAGLGGDWNNFICFVTKNANNDGTWSTAGGYPVQLGTAYDTNNFIVPLKNGRVYCFYFKGGEQIKGKLWNGVAWNAEETVTTSNILPQYSGGALPYETWSRGCTVDSDDTIHLVFLDTGEIAGAAGDPFSYNIRYLTRNLADGWSSETVIQADCLSKGVSPSIYYNETERFSQIFWTMDGLVYSRRVVDGNVQVKRVYVDERDVGIPDEAEGFYDNYDGTTNSFVKLFNGRFGLLYITGEEPTYSINFALESFGVEYENLDATLFNDVKQQVKNSFGLDNFNVTLSTLSLGAPNSTTGWYEPVYTDSTVEMVIQTRDNSNFYAVTGRLAVLDAIGFTTALVSVGSKVTNAALRVWRVMSVKPMMTGIKLHFYICDLKEVIT